MQFQKSVQPEGAGQAMIGRDDEIDCSQNFNADDGGIGQDEL